MKNYSEMLELPTLQERLDYLKFENRVGDETFGCDRYLNQILYRSPEWKRIRRQVILRDNGCELGVEDFPIKGRLMVHHIIPITKEDIINRNPKVFDLNNLVTCSHELHNAIHYNSDEMQSINTSSYTPRQPGDTKLWR